VQTAHTRLRREYDAATRKSQEQISAFERDLTDAKKYQDDYTALVDALKAHPDIAEMLAERLGKPGGARPPTAVTATVPPELQKRLEKLDKLDQLWDVVSQAQKKQQEAELRLQDQQVGQQLDGALKGLLTERQYDQKWLPKAKAYVLSRIRDMGPDADVQMEDIPYLFAEWFKDMEEFVQARTGQVVNGKREDQRLPPAPGPGAPVSGKPEVGALDGTTARALEAALRQSGWSG